MFGQIVALSYSLANNGSFAFGYYLTAAYEPELFPLTAPMAYVYVVIISAVGAVVFRKLQGLLKCKYVNAAAAAKLLIFLPLLPTVLLASAHTDSLLLAGPVDYNYDPANPSLSRAFGPLMSGCFGYFPTRPNAINGDPVEVFQILTLLKYHGWVGGASAVAVIVAGVALFVISRKIVKWRVTAAYFAGIAAMSGIMFASLEAIFC